MLSVHSCVESMHGLCACAGELISAMVHQPRETLPDMCVCVKKNQYLNSNKEDPSCIS